MLKKITWRTVLILIGLVLVGVLVWDYVWINLLRGGSVESP